MTGNERSTSTILPLGMPPPKAKSKVRMPLGKVSLQNEKYGNKCKNNNGIVMTYKETSIKHLTCQVCDKQNVQKTVRGSYIREYFMFYLTLNCQILEGFQCAIPKICSYILINLNWFLVPIVANMCYVCGRCLLSQWQWGFLSKFRWWSKLIEIRKTHTLELHQRFPVV